MRETRSKEATLKIEREQMISNFTTEKENFLKEIESLKNSIIECKHLNLNDGEMQFLQNFERAITTYTEQINRLEKGFIHSTGLLSNQDLEKLIEANLPIDRIF